MYRYIFGSGFFKRKIHLNCRSSKHCKKSIFLKICTFLQLCICKLETELELGSRFESDPKPDPEQITDPDPNLQIISDPAGSGCTPLSVRYEKCQENFFFIFHRRCITKIWKLSAALQTGKILRVGH
jgi:hypothetical protein